MNNYDNRVQKEFVEDRMYEDMVFNVTHILDSKTNIIYHMNEFSTIIYKNLKNGVDKDLILEKLKSIKDMPVGIEDDFNSLIKALLDKQIIKELKSSNNQLDIDEKLLKNSQFKLSFREFLKDGTKDLVIEYKRR